LALEGLSRANHSIQIKKPRKFLFWWKGLLDKHHDRLGKIAIETKFYADKKTAAI